MADNDWTISPQYGVPAKLPRQAAVTLSEMLRQSVPTGVEGDTRSALQRFKDDYAEPAPSLSKALLTYGNRVLVPAPDEIPGAMLDALSSAGDISLAYGPPSLGPAGPAATTLGMMLKSPQAIARVISRMKPAEVAPAAHAADDALNALSDQITASKAARAKVRAEARQTAYDAANPNRGPTVPKVDGLTPVRERNQVLDAIYSNPYVQPIKGRQGLPTKSEQAKLATQYFDNGGRLSPGGPWGRDMQQEIRDVLSKAARKVDNRSTGPMQNKPGTSEAVQAWKSANGQAQNAEKGVQDEVMKRYALQRKLWNLKNGIEE